MVLLKLEDCWLGTITRSYASRLTEAMEPDPTWV